MSKKYLDTAGLNKLVANILSRFAAKNHKHSAATTTQDGFMSANDKVKLDGIADGANKTIVDSTLSDTSINPIQNKAVKKALDGKVGNVNDGAVTISATVANPSMMRETSMTLDPFGGINFRCDNGNGMSVDGHSVIAENDVQLDAVTTTGNGNAYEASVKGIDVYTIDRLPAGTTFIMIPHVVSTNVSPTLDVNGLGAKPIRQRLSNSTQSTATGATAGWLAANKPVEVTYDGSYWVVDFVRPNMLSAYGTLPIANGGTGATTAEQARVNLGISAYDEQLSVLSEGVEKANNGVVKLNTDLPLMIRTGSAIVSDGMSITDTFTIFSLHTNEQIANMFGFIKEDFYPEFCCLVVDNADNIIFPGLVNTFSKAGYNAEGEYVDAMICATDIANTGVIPDLLQVGYTYFYAVPSKKCFAIRAVIDNHDSIIIYNRPVVRIPKKGDFFDGHNVFGVYEINENKLYDTADDVPWVNNEPDNFVFQDKISPIDISYWFANMSLIKNISNSDIKNLDLSRLIRCVGTFSNFDLNGMTIEISNKDIPCLIDCSDMCSSITGNGTFIIKNCNMPNLKNATNMFSSAGNMTLDLNNNITPSLEDVSGMFYNSTCTILNMFDTKSVKNMKGMFQNTDAYKWFKNKKLNTSNVVNMERMFADYCYSDNETLFVDIDTRNVLNMYGMFHYSKLMPISKSSSGYKLDLSSFDTKNVTDMSYMFGDRLANLLPNGANVIDSIFVSDKFVTDNVSDSIDMFTGCGGLIGGAGTKYDLSHTDKTYARIDNPPSAPGYFTNIIKDIHVVPAVVLGDISLARYSDSIYGQRSSDDVDAYINEQGLFVEVPWSEYISNKVFAEYDSVYRSEYGLYTKTIEYIRNEYNDMLGIRPILLIDLTPVFPDGAGTQEDGSYLVDVTYDMLDKYEDWFVCWCCFDMSAEQWCVSSCSDINYSEKTMTFEALLNKYD